MIFQQVKDRALEEIGNLFETHIGEIERAFPLVEKMEIKFSVLIKPWGNDGGKIGLVKIVYPTGDKATDEVGFEVQPDQLKLPGME